jgi:nitrite reductase (NADH) large subunit
LRFLIVGAGAAGINAATILRRKIQDLSIDVFSDEKYSFYSRPRLIEVLAKESTLERIYFHPESWYEANIISLHIGTRVMGIETDAHRVRIESGALFNYDKLLFATGALARSLPVEGSQKRGVFTFRTAADCFAIRDFAEGKERAVLIGGGLLGLECARSLRTLGLEVTVLEAAQRLLPRQLDAEGAALLQRMIEKTGIKVHIGAQVERIEGGDSVSSVSLRDGGEIATDIVIFSAGIVPNVKLARDAGIQVKDGILVDNFMRTSASDIFAAGDCAQWQGKVFGIIPAALEQSSVAAANMAAAESAEYQGTVPANTLKVVGVDVTSVGLTAPEKEEDYKIIRRADEQKGIYRKFVLKGDLLVGFILVGTARSAVTLTSLVRDKKSISAVEEILDKDLR